MSNNELPILRLNPKADKRIRTGHHWIFSNEVDNKSTPLTGFEAGQQVLLQCAKGKALGVATVNPNTLICARLISRNIEHRLDKSLIAHKINLALSLRERCFSEPFYRLIYGDSDGLSGLVVDRFNKFLVVQISTAGMELVKDEIVLALQQCLKPAAILFKNDGRMRELEGLDSYVVDAYGEVPDNVGLIENNTHFWAPVRHGQKTGWFYDHRIARAQLQKHATGKRVLDIFSYVGGWGLQAAQAGADFVLCVDSSEQALELIAENVALNDFQCEVATCQGSAFPLLQQLQEDGEHFDIVIVDPPAFIQRRKDIGKGLTAYRRINELALRLLNKDGLLVSASCSLHLSRAMLTDTLRGASRHVDRQLQIFSQGFQGPDHPIHPSIPETEYLKSLFCRVLPVN